MPEAHEERVARVAAQVRARPPQQRLGIRKKFPGHTPHAKQYKQGAHLVELEGLDHILSVDRLAKTARAEGLVTLEQLCRATLAQGLLPPVVPELETFTVGGLVAGYGIESSSHRQGLFPDTLEELEMVLGNGEVVTASRQQHADLFRFAGGTLGTLGIVTAATVRLVEAPPFVHSKYTHFEDAGRYTDALREATLAHDFVEGFVIAPRSYVLVAGNRSAGAAGLAVHHPMQHGQPRYHRHAAAMARSGGEDLVPAYEYLFRTQRGLFWGSDLIADSPLLAGTTWGRRILDRLTDANLRRRGLTSDFPPHLRERSLVLQDMGVRLERLPEALAWIERHLGIWPLWNCPYRWTPGFTRARPGLEGALMLDIGIYGEPTVKGYRAATAMQALQRFVDHPSLWGVSYLTAAELRERFDFEAYEALQEQYHARGVFSDLDSKLRGASAPDAGPIPLWRLVSLWHDVKAQLRERWSS